MSCATRAGMPGDAGLLPRHARGDAHERLDRSRDAVGVDRLVRCRPGCRRRRRRGRRRGAARAPRRRQGAGPGRGAAAGCRPGPRCRRRGSPRGRPRTPGPVASSSEKAWRSTRCWNSGSAGRPSGRPSGKSHHRPRGRCGVLDLVALRTERDRGQPLGLEDVGERTHGTRAQRSNRREQDDVDAHVGAAARRRPARCRGALR